MLPTFFEFAEWAVERALAKHLGSSIDPAYELSPPAAEIISVIAGEPIGVMRLIESPTIMADRNAGNLSDYTKRTPQQMLKDLNQAWDRIKLCEKTIEERNRAIDGLVHQVKRQRIKINVLTGIITTTLCATVFALFKAAVFALLKIVGVQ